MEKCLEDAKGGKGKERVNKRCGQVRDKGKGIWKGA